MSHLKITNVFFVFVIFGATITTIKTELITTNGCPKNQVAVAGIAKTTCKCVPGFTGEDNSDTCTACLAGKFKILPGNVSCTSCGAGKYSAKNAQTAESTCTSCWTGTYSEILARTTACTKCYGNSTTLIPGNTVISACKCNPGYTGEDGVSCSACSAGTVKTRLGSASCTQCDTGKYSGTLARTTRCDSCHVYSTTLNPESTAITDCICNPGYTGVDGVSCSACSAGTFKTSAIAGNASCSACPIGTHSGSLARTTDCNACHGNSTTLNSSSTVITDCICNPGYTGVDGVSCAACVAGTFKISTGSVNCTLCGTGKFSGAIAAANDVCQACAMGTYSAQLGNKAQSDCDNCPTGTFSAALAASDVSTCILCDVAEYQMSTGAININACMQCPLGEGFIYNGSANASCVRCFPGSYKDTESMQSCTLCSGNTTTTSDGSKSSSSCVCAQGHSRDGQGICQGCGAGKFKVLIGDTSCVNCGAGKFSNSIAQKSGTACQPCGQFSSSFPGSRECICDAGAEKIFGNISCTQCAQNSYKTFTGNTACTPCQPNSVTEFIGVTANTTCKCQSDLGWSLKPGGDLEVCEQVVQELFAKFQLPVVMSDFVNDVDNVTTKFTVAIASAFGVEPMNITLIYYAAEGMRNTLRQSRRLLQNRASATIVETRIKVFQSKRRPSATQVTASLTLSLPNVLILELPISAIQVTPVPAKDTLSKFFWYVLGAGAIFLFMLFLCIAVLIRWRYQTHLRHVVYYPHEIKYHDDEYVQNINHTEQSYYPSPHTTHHAP